MADTATDTNADMTKGTHTHTHTHVHTGTDIDACADIDLLQNHKMGQGMFKGKWGRGCSRGNGAGYVQGETGKLI